MQVFTINEAEAKVIPEQRDYFQGEVGRQMLHGPSSEIEVMAVFFGPGERTKPHVHQRDQVLHIVSGQGIVATETERRVVGPGDVVFVPAGEWHWHGATSSSAMCHISIKQFGPTEWEVEPKNWASGYDEA